MQSLGNPVRRWCLIGALGIAAAACGAPSEAGDCGSVLSSAECQVVRTQLGLLDPHPPADASNRWGRCVSEGSSECFLEEQAATLGHRLFFDTCLSSDKKTGCVTCHDPGVAFVDARRRQILGPVTMTMNGVTTTVRLPLIENPTMERLRTPPPEVQPQKDLTGAPLAYWDEASRQWQPVTRRPQSSWGVLAPQPNMMPPVQQATGRHSPSVYNMGYGAVLPQNDGARTSGAVWTPWDGRYDSAWALVADVLEFGATQATNRSHVALRIFRQHRAAYEAMTGLEMPDLDAKETNSQLYIYPRSGAPSANGDTCWNKPSMCTDAMSLAPTPLVRDQINQIFTVAGKALAAYMRRLVSSNSPYDRFVRGEHEAMTGAAQRGLRLFIGKAECIMCHNGPNFSDWRFHNLGVPAYDPEKRTAGSLVTDAASVAAACYDGLAPMGRCPDPGRQGWQVRASGTCAVDTPLPQVGGTNVTCQRVDLPDGLERYDVAMDCRSKASDVPDADKDRLCQPASVVPVSKCSYKDAASCAADPLCAWAGNLKVPVCTARSTVAEHGQFRTPSLRNIALTFPYMHNGALYDYGPAERGEVPVDDPTPHLRRVVEFYNQGGAAPMTGTLDPLIRPLHLTSGEVNDLVEFLKALTDNSLATENRGGLATPPPDLVSQTTCP